MRRVNRRSGEERRRALRRRAMMADGVSLLMLALVALIGALAYRAVTP